MAIEFPIYLDHAATTPVAPEVLEAMLPYFSEYYGNPATLYSLGMAAREAVENAREIVAETLNASPEEIVFTSGGTESDNMALRGVAEANSARGRHILTTPIEHHAVLEPLELLARQGFEVEFLPLDAEGRVAPAEVARRIRPDTLLVSVMHANNEIGTVEPIAEIGAICRERSVLFHTDAVQTFGKLPLDVRAMRIDLLSLSAHKLYGPKGVGALYVRRGTPLARFQAGGEQEKGRRGGTLNVPGIVGLGKATERARAEMDSEAQRLSALRDRFLERLRTAIPGVHISGSRTERLPNNLHFCVEGVEGEPMLLALDAAGICAAAGSACTTGSPAPSHVLLALGMPEELARGALRLTLGRATTEEALDYTLETLRALVADLRGLAGFGGRPGVLAGTL
ncbi:MAG TPA: cysteine desulfurase family protein [Chthonomonadaceae bacterium]|nr:cysteine desulfurase family protein [Chthonomonadaceae bacterium]